MTIVLKYMSWYDCSIRVFLQVFAIEFVTFAIDFILFAVAFAVEFVQFAIEFVSFALEFVVFAQEFNCNKIGSCSKHENKM